jgi:phage protein D
MTLVTSVQIKLEGTPLTPEQQRVLQSLEVEHGVSQQGMFKIRLAIGQDSSGDWAEGAESIFTPAKRISIEVTIGENRRRLINGLLTEFRMNFQADPCQSQLELVGMDALEKMKRRTSRRSRPTQPIRAIVNDVFQASGIQPPVSGVPDAGVPNQNRETLMQTHNDLEFLRMLADTVNCEAYVEPLDDVDQGHFEPLPSDLTQPPAMRTDISVSQGTFTHVRNASFYYDLSQATVVQARMTDAQGRDSGVVKSDLRDKVNSRFKTLLGPPDFAKVEDLNGHGRETRDQLQQLCDAALEKRSWVVVGKGDLDSSLYGDALIPRRAVQVNGISRAFSGTYLVWKVTHSFTRESYCQKFELRRKLAVN